MPARPVLPTLGIPALTPQVRIPDLVTAARPIAPSVGAADIPEKVAKLLNALVAVNQESIQDRKQRLAAAAQNAAGSQVAADVIEGLDLSLPKTRQEKERALSLLFRRLRERGDELGVTFEDAFARTEFEKAFGRRTAERVGRELRETATDPELLYTLTEASVNDAVNNARTELFENPVIAASALATQAASDTFAAEEESFRRTLSSQLDAKRTEYYRDSLLQDLAVGDRNANRSGFRDYLKAETEADFKKVSQDIALTVNDSVRPGGFEGPELAAESLLQQVTALKAQGQLTEAHILAHRALANTVFTDANGKEVSRLGDYTTGAVGDVVSRIREESLSLSGEEESQVNRALTRLSRTLDDAALEAARLAVADGNLAGATEAARAAAQQAFASNPDLVAHAGPGSLTALDEAVTNATKRLVTNLELDTKFVQYLAAAGDKDALLDFASRTNPVSKAQALAAAEGGAARRQALVRSDAYKGVQAAVGEIGNLAEDLPPGGLDAINAIRTEVSNFTEAFVGRGVIGSDEALATEAETTTATLLSRVTTSLATLRQQAADARQVEGEILGLLDAQKFPEARAAFSAAAAAGRLSQATRTALRGTLFSLEASSANTNSAILEIARGYGVSAGLALRGLTDEKDPAYTRARDAFLNQLSKEFNERLEATGVSFAERQSSQYALGLKIAQDILAEGSSAGQEVTKSQAVSGFKALVRGSVGSLATANPVQVAHIQSAVATIGNNSDISNLASGVVVSVFSDGGRNTSKALPGFLARFGQEADGAKASSAASAAVGAYSLRQLNKRQVQGSLSLSEARKAGFDIEAFLSRQDPKALELWRFKAAQEGDIQVETSEGFFGSDKTIRFVYDTPTDIGFLFTLSEEDYTSGKTDLELYESATRFAADREDLFKSLGVTTKEAALQVISEARLRAALLYYKE